MKCINCMYSYEFVRDKEGERTCRCRVQVGRPYCDVEWNCGKFQKLANCLKYEEINCDPMGV